MVIETNDYQLSHELCVNQTKNCSCEIKNTHTHIPTHPHTFLNFISRMEVIGFFFFNEAMFFSVAEDIQSGNI